MSWEQFCNDARRIVNRAAEKINQTADIASMQVKLASAEHRLSVAYEELGQAAYPHFAREAVESTDTSAIFAAIKKVDEAMVEVERIRTDLEAKKAAGKAQTESTDGQEEASSASDSEEG